MDNSIDEPMSSWDHCKKAKDFKVFDWKEEVAKLSEAQRLALFHSPLGAEKKRRKIPSIQKFMMLMIDFDLFFP